jgi:hypothetical protein
MTQLSPSLDLLKSAYLAPSDRLLLRWAEEDPDLPPRLRAALEADPEARARRDRLVEACKLPLEITQVPPPAMPEPLVEMNRRRQASRAAKFPPKPAPGQILRIDEVHGPDGPLDVDLPRPLAVLLDEPDPEDPDGQVWSGWMVSPETEYRGYWDLLLGPEDEPCDPLAGMVQAWNPVHIYLPSTGIVLGQLSAERLDAVRALFDELLGPDEQDPSLAQPGVTVTRKIQGGHEVRTGTPLGTEADPRWGYADLFGRIIAEKAVKQPARLAAARRGEKAAWIENLVDSLREGFASLGLALSPTDKPERHRLALPPAGGTLLRAATLPSGDLLDIAVVPSGESDRLRLRISSLSSLPLDVALETAGEPAAPVRL